MAKYLTRLWDDYSRIVLTNARDFDARDSDYAQKVSQKVWETVRAMRAGRTSFRRQIRAELGSKRSGT